MGHVDLYPRRKILTHGQVAVAMITSILFQVMQLYRICKFASEKNVLQVLLPNIEAEEYFDDRLADTLDALFAHGIGDLDMLITGHMIDVFQIENQVCQYDTTSVSMNGEADNIKTDHGIQVTFGHRPDFILHMQHLPTKWVTYDRFNFKVTDYSPISVINQDF